MLKSLLKQVPDQPMFYLITAHEKPDEVKVHYFVHDQYKEPVFIYQELVRRSNLSGGLLSYIEHGAERLYHKLKSEGIPICCSEMHESSVSFSVYYAPGTIAYLSVGMPVDKYEEFGWKPEEGKLPVYVMRGDIGEYMTVFGYIRADEASRYYIPSPSDRDREEGMLRVCRSVESITFTHNTPPTKAYMESFGLPWTGVFYNDCVELEQAFNRGNKCVLNSI